MSNPGPGPIPPPLTVGDTVWNDANANGVQEIDEAGLADVTVNLLDNDVVIATTLTDALGQYQFTAPATGSAYQVQVVVPTGYAATAQYAGPEDQDSNIDATGYTEVFSLDSAGPGNNTLDAGLVSTATATIGDRVWLDANEDGIQDTGEAGMAGVGVVLYGAGGSVVATATTGTNGVYQFTGVAPNADYHVQFVAPEGYEFTTRYAGLPEEDSDADEYGATEEFFVAAGVTQLGKDAGLKVKAQAAEVIVQIQKHSPQGAVWANKLRVAKWENAFSRTEIPAAPPNPAGFKIDVKTNFIDLDPDRFIVVVWDPAKNVNAQAKDTLKIKVQTFKGSDGSEQDPGNDLVLEETDINTGVFSTKTLLLMSVPADDTYKVDGVNNDFEGDRTFFVELGDNFKATYGTKSAAAAVPVEKKVKLHVTILRNKALAAGGAPVATLTTVDAYIYAANQIYAPLGIIFEPNVQVTDPPPGVVLDDEGGLDEFPRELDAKQKIQMTAEEKALLGAADLRTAAKDDIEVYLVNELSRGSAEEAFPALYVPDAKYADSLVMKGVTNYQTLAHEILHVLSEIKDHPIGDQDLNIVNLLADPQSVTADKGVFNSRRITPAQANKVVTKPVRPNLLLAP